jgi:two-component system response regulator AtoC
MQSATQFESQPAFSGLPVAAAETPRNLGIIGASPAWHKLLMQVEMVAPYAQIAAIEGEHGCGKETLARYLHTRGPLARSAFQRHDARQWLVTEADPATLSGFIYLDRVDLLAAPGQGLLLAVLKLLQDRPAGRTVLITSSQMPLRQMTSQGLLMPDLAFRLTALRFAVPPLRHRKEDIVPLAQALLERICKRYQHRPVTLTQSALARLLQHSWPGNLRELASVLEASLLEAADGLIRAEDLPITPEIAPRAEQVSGAPAHGLLLDEVIRQHVQYVLEVNGGNKVRAARQLGISRSTLYRILGNELFPAQERVPARLSA